MGAGLAQADPEADLAGLVKHYKDRLPDLKPQDYIFGALAYNKDSMEQYLSIMDFPPYLNDMDKAKALWNKPFKNGKTFGDCFPNKGKNVAGDYPMFDDASGKVVTFENAINSCLKANGETEYDYGDMKTMGLVTAYAKSLSDGSKVNVKVQGKGALEAYEKGKTFFYSRRGQLNFSCATCHVDNVGKSIRSDALSPTIGQTSHWPEFRSGTEPTTLQTRFRQCNIQVRSAPLPQNSEEYNNLEYFLSYMSNGLPMQTPVFRK
jgi:sulfur-oxidizing protein SoxA